MPRMTDHRWKPSVTVAAIIEHQGLDGPQYLLIEEHTPEGLRLNNPAGHLEQGETPEQAVCREALEETGCHFRPASLVGVYLSRFQRPARGEDVTYLRLAYAGTCSAPQPGHSLDEGIVRTVWMTPQEIQASQERHRSPLVWRCIADHLAGRRFPLNVVQADGSLLSPEIKQGPALAATAAMGGDTPDP
jgi:8-oxo-dGTP pyrophosphatase MutT (NUDIX family)